MKIVQLIFFVILPCSLVAQLPPDVIPVITTSEFIVKKGKTFIPDKYLNTLQFHENLAPVRVKDSTSLSAVSKIAFVNTASQVVIPPSFDHLFKYFNKGRAIIGIDSRETALKGVIDKNNKLLIPPVFSEIGASRGEITLVSKEDQWGFYNTMENKLYNPLYENILFYKKDYLLVTLKGKKGLIDRAGKEVLPVRYKSILSKKDGTVEVKSFKKYFLRNLKNIVFAQLECDSIVPLEKKLYLYYIDDKCGIINDTFISVPSYNYVSDFIEGKAFVKKGKYYGIIDTLGQEIMPIIYEDLKRDSEGNYYIKGSKAKQFGVYFLKEKNTTWAVYDKFLHLILPFQYTQVGGFGDSLFAVMNDSSKWGYVNYANKLIIPYKYDFAKPYSNGYAEVGVRLPYRKIFFYIDHKGDTAVSPQYHLVFASGMGARDTSGKIVFHYPYNLLHKFSPISKDFIKVKYGYRYGVANASSDLIVLPEYDSVTYSQQENVVIVYKDGESGIFNSKGDTILSVSNKYDEIFPFSDGYARVRKNDRYGCIDMNKNRRIAIQYSKLYDFKEGRAAAIINGKWGFIDKGEQIAVQPYFVEARSFQRGLARVKTGNYWDFVNSTGKRINSALYDNIENTSTDKWLLSYNGKKGLADSTGREMLVPRYSYAMDLGDGLLQVWREGKTGILDYEQNFVLPIEYDNIQYDKINKIFIIKEPGTIENTRL